MDRENPNQQATGNDKVIMIHTSARGKWPIE
jgi:hypothetical protein